MKWWEIDEVSPFNPNAPDRGPTIKIEPSKRELWSIDMPKLPDHPFITFRCSDRTFYFRENDLFAFAGLKGIQPDQVRLTKRDIEHVNFSLNRYARREAQKARTRQQMYGEPFNNDQIIAMNRDLQKFEIDRFNAYIDKAQLVTKARAEAIKAKKDDPETHDALDHVLDRIEAEIFREADPTWIDPFVSRKTMMQAYENEGSLCRSIKF